MAVSVTDPAYPLILRGLLMVTTPVTVPRTRSHLNRRWSQDCPSVAGCGCTRPPCYMALSLQGATVLKVRLLCREEWEWGKSQKQHQLMQR
jgi:hypothetical protein